MHLPPSSFDLNSQTTTRAIVRIMDQDVMSHPIFLIDLASARPPSSPPIEQWPALFKEHSNQLVRCIRRIIAHSNVESVTTHVFDSTVLAQSGILSTKPLKDSLKDLNRIPGYVSQIDTTGVRHPTARGVLAGLLDAAPEDNFSEFYPEAKAVRDIYIFARAPATRGALAAFIGRNELALSALTRQLANTTYLSNKFEEFAKRGDRLIWVNSTPRRCERVGDVDAEVERVFANWLLSFDSNFQIVTLHSFLIDRRIVPAKTMVRGLWDGSVENGLGRREIVEVFCLQNSQLLRCFTACINVLHEDTNEGEKQTALVLSGLVRNYRTEELSKFGAFDTPAQVLTPASMTSHDQPDEARPPNSSIFAGLMVDLARQDMSLVADFFQIGHLDGFTRYQTILQPITPLSAVLRKVSRTESSVNYNSSCLPQSFEEWKSWDKLENVKDCEITDSVIDASAKFFETYLPTLFSIEGRGNTGLRDARTMKHASKKAEISQSDRVLLSFEGDAALLPYTDHEAFAGFHGGPGDSPKTSSKEDHATGSKTAARDLIIKQLQAQENNGHEKLQQMSSRAAPPEQIQTPDKCKKGKGHEVSSRASSKFTWSRPNQVVAPSKDAMQICIDVHSQHKDEDRCPKRACKSKHKSMECAFETPSTIGRSESIVSPTILKRNGQACLPETNSESPVFLKADLNPSILQCHPNSGNSLTDAVKTRGRSERKATELSRLLGRERKVSLSKIAADGNSKRKSEELVGQEQGADEPRRSLNKKSRSGAEDLRSQCELTHGKQVRCVMQAFANCLDKLRKEDEDVEAAVWESVALLSSLAKALSVYHPQQCDMDRKINLNLKIPKAVSEAVQEVQNKVTNDEFSPTIVLREMWETILSAFEQAMWHLASARRTAMIKPNKKRVNRRVREVSNILSCVQFMAETASSSHRQPVSFRQVFSTLFSTVFAHLCRNDSGEPIPPILNLFEEYEEAVPTALHAADIKGSTNKKNADGEETRTNLQGSSTPHDPQPSRVGSSRNEDTPFPLGKDHLADKSLKTTRKRSRASRTGPSTIRADARNSITKITLSRSQFAKESEALRNAVRSQTRLPLQSKKTANKAKSQSKIGKQGISNGASETFISQVQDLFASAVPTQSINKHATDEPEEDSVEQTPPPSIQNAKNDKVVVQGNITRDFNCDRVQHIAGAAEGKTSSSARKEDNDRHRQRLVLAKKTERNGKLVGDELETTSDSCPNKQSFLSSRTNGRQLREDATGAKRRDEGHSIERLVSSVGSTDGVTTTKANHGVTKETCQDETSGDQHCSSSRHVECANQGQENQVQVDKVKEASIDASREAPCRLTRSQAKRTGAKRRLEVSSRHNEHSPTSSGQKKRRRRQVNADPKYRSECSGLHDSSPTSSSPMTRSQAKAMEKSASLQLRKRSLPRRLATAKPAIRAAIEHSESPLTQNRIDGSKTRPVRPSTPTRNVCNSENASGSTPISALSPHTPVAFATTQEESAIHRIVNSSLEKRKEQLEEEDFVPETPVPPKLSSIVPPDRKSVRRILTF